MSFPKVIALSFLCIFANSCITLAAEDLSVIKNCKASVQSFMRSKPLHKALAVAGQDSTRPGYRTYGAACGFIWNKKTKAQAIKIAMRECNRGTKKIHYTGKCHLVLAQ